MYCIIVNPVAGKGKGKRIFTSLKNTEIYQGANLATQHQPVKVIEP